MKILQLAYKSDITGGEKVLLQVCRALSRAGHEVEVLCPGPGDLVEELRSMGIACRFERLSKTYDLPAARRIAGIVLREQFSLLHSHGMLVNILGRFAARMAGHLPNVSTVHLTHDFLGAPRVGGLCTWLKNALYYRTLDNFSSRFCSRIVAVSEAVRGDLLKQGIDGAGITVIPNGIDPACFEQVGENEILSFRRELGCDEETVLLGMIARLSPQKDIPGFIRALDRLRRSRENVKAFIAGSGPAREKIEQAITGAGLNAIVTLLGFRRDVPLLLRSCDVFVLSSLWEGLPLTVLEAMASSKPVVATAVDGTAEAVVDGVTGMLVPPADPGALAAALERLTADRELRLVLGKAGRSRLEERFHVKRVAESYVRLYEELVK